VNRLQVRLPSANHRLALQRIAALEAEVAQLTDAAASRQRLGFVSGLIAERYGLGTDDAWGLLVDLSQRTNVKVREVARLILDGFEGRIAEEDRALAARINALGPRGGRPLIRTVPEGDPDVISADAD
jgi:hypothetical protein